jgi:hypothetical protein
MSERASVSRLRARPIVGFSRRVAPKALAFRRGSGAYFPVRVSVLRKSVFKTRSAGESNGFENRHEIGRFRRFEFRFRGPEALCRPLPGPGARETELLVPISRTGTRDRNRAALFSISRPVSVDPGSAPRNTSRLHRQEAPASSGIAAGGGLWTGTIIAEGMGSHHGA